jgi:hypothetical protein
MLDYPNPRLTKALLGLTITLAAILGLIVGGGIHIGYVTVTKPLTITSTATILKTATVIRLINNTLTTAVNGKVETVTSTFIESYITTVVVNHTTTVILPITTTVNHTTTVTSTTTIPPYTLTVTTTVVENASVLPPLNLTNLNETIAWMKTDYTLSMLGMVNLTLPLGYCEATIWVFPNASAALVGVWITPVSNVEQYLNESIYWGLNYTFPKTGVIEYPLPTPAMVWINPETNFVYTMGFSKAWALSITNYPYANYTVVVGVLFSSQVLWAFQYLNNGTYLMIYTWPKQIPSGYPISLVENPPGLCLIQVIRVKPGTPDSYILNMTYLGAQYWNWVYTEAKFGEPAPCYVPWSWTYGYAFWRINITEPIGDNWAYYCSPSKGIWYPLKP